MSNIAALDRLGAVRAALTAAGVPEPKGAGLQSFDLTQGPLALSLWYAQALERGLSEVYSESWPTDETEVGDGSSFRDAGDHASSGIFEFDGALAFVVLRNGEAHLSVAASTRDEIAPAISDFRARYPFTAPPTDDLVPVTFWSYGQFGPQSYTRRIEVAPWDAITENYTSEDGVKAELTRVMQDFTPGQGGQLLLWQGPPGTGKTWALRALASEWREWAEFHYVTDPDAFFGEHADYMVEVLLREAWTEMPEDGTEPAEKWRLLVLEDTGELLAADAKAKSGQALSRLLNVVDGLIGQGLRVLVLVTTNDEIDSFHPAVARPGRCASKIIFAPLTAEEVAARTGDDDAEPATLAEVYARRGTSEDPALTSDAAPNLGGTVDTETQELATDVRPDRQPTAEVELPEPTARASQVKWQAILLEEDKLTDDGRYIAPGATTWRELPLSLMAMTETSGEGHVGAFLCGRIDEIWREGNLVMGAGVFNDDDDGTRVASLVADRMLTGNSVDLAVREFELAPRSDFDENGKRIVRDESDGEEEVDLFDLLMSGENLAYVFVDCIIGMSTVCPFPAFADASITVTASALQWKANRQSGMIVVADAPPVLRAAAEPEVEEVDEEALRETLNALLEEDTDALTAAVEIPTTPPAEWFSDPNLTEPTPLTVTDDGKVFGHAALWDSCHIGIPDVCTTAPRSYSNYAYFLLKEVEVEDGATVETGTITLGTGHAPKHFKRQAAASHYDDTGSAVADIAVGEDDFGIWFSGGLRPGLTAERIRELRASVLSGDWRNVNGNLELVGVLAVNVPGFPVPRTPRALLAAGTDSVRVETLIAAGVNLERFRLELTDTEQAKLRALAARATGGLDGLAELAAA